MPRILAALWRRVSMGIFLGMPLMSLAIWIVLVPLIGWRLYARFNKLTTRQKVRPLRSRLALYGLPVLLLTLALVSRNDNLAFGALLAGTALGLIIASYGLKWTKYENHEGQLFYTHNVFIGVGLFLLLLGRLAYRLFQSYHQGMWSAGPVTAQAMLHSPLTLGIVGIILAYNACYAGGILRWRRAMRATAAGQFAGQE